MNRLSPEDKRAAITAAWTQCAGDVKAVEHGCYFDAAAGFHVVKFFHRFLRHSTGQWAGEPFILLPWQRRMLMRLFGWKREDGTRRFRIAFIEIAKKNGKSALGSGLALYLLCADGESGAQIFSAAGDRDQAGIVYKEAANMVKASPDLKKRLNIIDSRKTITFELMGAFYRVLSAEAYTSEGLNIHGLIFDELHTQKTRELWDALRYGGAARRQPLLISITTAGFDRHSICYEQYDYACKVRDGIIEDDAFFPFIAEAHPEKDLERWTEPEVWHKANPSLGHTIDLESFAADCREAQQSVTKENSFKRYRLNIWTQQEMRWLKMEHWNKCGVKEVNPELLRGRPCWAGLDIGATSDLTALCLLFPEEVGFQALWRFWAPREKAEHRERTDRVPYLAWAKQGYLKLTDGNETDYATVRKDINDIHDVYPIQEIAGDRLFQGAQMLQELKEQDGFVVVPHGMGFLSMAAPTAELERLVNRGEFHHGNNPIMRWMASNVAVEMDAPGNIKPSKAKSSEKIDGVISAVIALSRAIVRKKVGSIYATRGIRTIG